MFTEDVKGETMNLKLRIQTSNMLPDRRRVGRPRKAPLEATHKPEAASSKDPETDFQPDIYKSAEATCSDNHAHPTRKANNNDQKESEDQNNGKAAPRSLNYPDPSFTSEPLVTIASQKFLHVTIPKQKRDNDEDEHCDKIPRAFAALIAEELDADDYNNIKEVLAAFTNSPATSKINILTPTIYKQAVKDPM